MNKEDPNMKLEQIRASLEAIILTEKPDVHWDDVAGLESAKARLKEAIVFPLKFPRLFTGQPAPWVLLYGPYGAGKSYIAKAAATEAKCTFLSFSCRELVGNIGFERQVMSSGRAATDTSCRLVKQLFDRARESKPAMIFLDDIHWLTPDQAESDGLRGQTNPAGHDDTGVVVLAATHVPWQLNGPMKGRCTLPMLYFGRSPNLLIQ
jgi:vacuolar protein-sorting-associated protein 4